MDAVGPARHPLRPEASLTPTPLSLQRVILAVAASSRSLDRPSSLRGRQTPLVAKLSGTKIAPVVGALRRVLVRLRRRDRLELVDLHGRRAIRPRKESRPQSQNRAARRYERVKWSPRRPI